MMQQLPFSVMGGIDKNGRNMWYQKQKYFPKTRKKVTLNKKKTILMSLCFVSVAGMYRILQYSTVHTCTYAGHVLRAQCSVRNQSALIEIQCLIDVVYVLHQAHRMTKWGGGEPQ